MLLCKATLAHAPVMAAFHLPCFFEPWSEKSFADLLALPTSVGWIHEGGFILCSVILDEMEILTLCTLPQKRRNGIGRALLMQAEAFAKAHGIHHIYLEVSTQNQAAQALYQAQNYQVCGYRKGYYKTPTGFADAVCMGKNIG